ncbi:MAG TPA: hypothetical protein VFD70_10820 [Anaerolineae bacterium]|nr:hypothetical protein [Anaerolineae bacterium]
MNLKEIHKRLQEQWERALEQAAEQPTTRPELGEMLTNAASLHIRSGVKSGALWGTTSCTCYQGCTNIC